MPLLSLLQYKHISHSIFQILPSMMSFSRFIFKLWHSLHVLSSHYLYLHVCTLIILFSTFFCSLPISGFWSIHGPIFPWLNVSLQIKSRQNLWDSLTVLTLSDTPLRMDLWNKSSLREKGVFRQRLVWTGILSFVWPWVCKCRQMNTLQCVEFCRNRRLREFPPKKSNVQTKGGQGLVEQC